ncbi:hypothetical protein JCM11672_27680 [Alkaliphilus crotonatoxidans]
MRAFFVGKYTIIDLILPIKLAKIFNKFLCSLDFGQKRNKIKINLYPSIRKMEMVKEGF